MTIPDSSLEGNAPVTLLDDEDFGLDLLNIPESGAGKGTMPHMGITPGMLAILVLTATASFALGMLAERGIDAGAQAGVTTSAPALTGSNAANAANGDSQANLPSGAAPSLLPNSTSAAPSYAPSTN